MMRGGTLTSPSGQNAPPALTQTPPLFLFHALLPLLCTRSSRLMPRPSLPRPPRATGIDFDFCYVLTKPKSSE